MNVYGEKISLHVHKFILTWQINLSYFVMGAFLAIRISFLSSPPTLTYWVCCIESNTKVASMQTTLFEDFHIFYGKQNPLNSTRVNSLLQCFTFFFSSELFSFPLVSFGNQQLFHTALPLQQAFLTPPSPAFWGMQRRLTSICCFLLTAPSGTWCMSSEWCWSVLSKD